MAATAAIAAPAAGAAVTTTYPFQDNASNFSGNQGGWASEVQLRGICLFGGGLTCPVITPSFQTGGGVDGPADGFLRVKVASLTDVASDARGIWRSPPFLYNGASGGEPERITFKITRQANVQSFVSLPGNSATYTVQLVNTTTGKALTLIDEETLTGAEKWAEVGPITVDPADLDMGTKYRLEIIAHFVSVAILIPNSTADFDDVRLVASRPESTTLGNVVSNRTELINLLRPLGPRSATLKKKRLKARIYCPAKSSEDCQYSVAALLSRAGPKITATRDVRLKPGASKVIGLVVKDQYVDKLRKRGRAVLRERVLVGQVHASVYKTIKVN
jgi:hypothetical protein